MSSLPLRERLPLKLADAGAERGLGSPTLRTRLCSAICCDAGDRGGRPVRMLALLLLDRGDIVPMLSAGADEEDEVLLVEASARLVDIVIVG